jgi:hypothetical protein
MSVIKVRNGNNWDVIHYDSIATEENYGVAKISTYDDIVNGVDDTSFITPKKFREFTENLITTDEVVHITGDETISGLKTFTTSPVVPTPATTDNSTKVATTAYVNTKLESAIDTDAVHKSGNEEISGTKTFITPFVRKSNTHDFSDTTTEGSFAFSEYVSKDKNNKNIGIIYSQRNPTSLLTNRLYRTYDQQDNSKYVDLNVYRKDGTSYGARIDGNSGTNDCLTTASSSTTDTILATKGWVNNPEVSKNVVHRSGDETIGGLKTFTTSPVVPTPSETDNSTKVATTAWVTSKLASAIDTDAVHKSGNEEISGIKTFTNEIKRSVALSGASEWTLRTIDTNDKGYTALVSYYTGENIYHRVLAHNTTASKNMYLDIMSKDDGTGSISIGGSATEKYVNLNGATKVRVPTPTTSAEVNEAVNIAYLNDASKSTGIVHRAGTETITGVKIFNGANGIIKYKSTEIDTTTAPSSNLYTYTDCLDKNNVRVGVIGSIMNEGGYYGTYLQAGNKGQLCILTNGTSTYATAPTPPTDDNSTKIATTNWVNSKIESSIDTDINDKFQVVSSVPSTPNDGVFYFVLSE